MKLRDYHECKEELDKELRELKEMKCNFDSVTEVLVGINDDRKSLDVMTDTTKRFQEKIEGLEKRRREDKLRIDDSSDEPVPKDDGLAPQVGLITCRALPIPSWELT